MGWSTIDKIVVRGHDLPNELIGQIDLGSMAFLEIMGRRPTVREADVFNALLVTLVEHGMTPQAIATRMISAAAPEALQAAVAAGLCGVGSVFAGGSEQCAKILHEALKDGPGDHDLVKIAADLVESYVSRKTVIPGIGHPVHKPVDPRAERMIALARQRGVAGRSVEAALALTKAAAATWGKPLPMNVSMTIAATLRDVGVPPGLIRAAPILARTAGLIAHCIEEAETPIGFLMASKGEEAILHSADADGAA